MPAEMIASFFVVNIIHSQDVQNAAPQGIKNGVVLVRQFIYLPLGPHLERLFGTSNLAQIVQSHSCVDKADSMYYIHHSPSWLHTYHPDGVFKGDNHGIALGLCTDGVNPFSHLRVSYSMWPNIILVGIVPGNGKKEPKDINPYLEIVVDELLPLSNVTQFDSYQNAPFQLKIEVLCTFWTIQGWKS